MTLKAGVTALSNEWPTQLAAQSLTASLNEDRLAQRPQPAGKNSAFTFARGRRANQPHHATELPQNTKRCGAQSISNTLTYSTIYLSVSCTFPSAEISD